MRMQGGGIWTAGERRKSNQKPQKYAQSIFETDQSNE
jgi:hypothetical protein